jgi:hypothetical protein
MSTRVEKEGNLANQAAAAGAFFYKYIFEHTHKTAALCRKN